MATSLAVPVAYITVLVTALAIFSRIYRKRQAAEKRAFEPWFPTHPQRDIYHTLLSADPSSTSGPGPVPDSLLKSALLNRAQADVKRIWRLRDDKQALVSLHQRGLVGDDTMARFEAAEKELEAEVVDVVQEANTFRQGWGQIIFGTATEMAQAERTREVVMSIPKLKAEEDRKQARRARFLPKSAINAIPAAGANGTGTLSASSSSAGVSTTSAAAGGAAPSTPAKSAIPKPSTPANTSTGPASAASTPAPVNAPANAAASGSASTSASSSRGASPGPDAALNGTGSGTGSGGKGANGSGTPGKSTPGKKKKGKK